MPQLWVVRIFGVPSDDAFSINDDAEVVPGLKWIAFAKELKAYYSCSRIRSAAQLNTNSELSAINRFNSIRLLIEGRDQSSIDHHADRIAAALQTAIGES